MPKKIKDFRVKFNLNLEDSFNKAFLKSVGKTAAQVVYRRTKSGKDKDSSALKPLSLGYISSRKQYTGTKGKFFSPARSNLTRTGQMLDAILVKIERSVITLSVDTSLRDDGLTNSEVAQYVSKSRAFFSLTDDEIQILIRMVEKQLRAFVRRMNL